MGRKLIGLTAGFLLTLVLAYVLFPVEYDSIIRWLAPFLGPWLRFFFMYIFVIFAHPLTTPTIIIVWAVVGFVAGLFARTFWGMIPVIIGIFFLTGIMMITGIVAMILPLFLSGGLFGFDFMALFNAIPPDVSVFDILRAPVIGPIINTVMEGIGDLLGSGGTPNIGAVLVLIQNVLLQTIILPVILNFIICLIAGLIGALLGRALFGPRS